MGRRPGQAYSQDLRDRVIGAVDGGLSAGEAAALFRVSVSYIYKALIRRRMTGETSARPQRNHVPPKLAGHEEAVAAEVARRPDATIADLRAWLLETHGISVGHAVMWKALARLGLTFKKRRFGRPSRSGRTSPPPESAGARDSPG
jgi:transposase